MAIEEPHYKTVLKNGAFELRHYEPIVIAEVTVSGDLKEASTKGFRLLADFIFGNNISENGIQEKIAMTAPVLVKPHINDFYFRSSSSRIADSNHCLVQFTMPHQYTLETLPKPNNPKVNIKLQQARKVAVLKFSGLTSEKVIERKTIELNAWVQSKQFKQRSDIVELARYNPPWTLPFLRRNELMIEVD